MALFFKVLSFQEKKKKSHITSIKTVTNWTAGKVAHTSACPSLSNYGHRLFPSVQWPPEAHIWMWLPWVYYFISIFFQRNLEWRDYQGLSWTCHKLEAGTGLSKVVLAKPLWWVPSCVLLNSTNQTHQSVDLLNVMRWFWECSMI